jgi:hypothetical protein
MGDDGGESLGKLNCLLAERTAKWLLHSGRLRT